MAVPFARSLEGIIISTVMLFVLVWQAKSALLLAGITVDSMVHLWFMRSALLLYVVFAFISMGAQDAQERARSEVTQ